MQWRQSNVPFPLLSPSSLLKLPKDNEDDNDNGDDDDDDGDDDWWCGAVLYQLRCQANWEVVMNITV